MTDTCANCDSTLSGPYCAQCGEPRFHPHHLSFRHFLHELVHEITHLEGHLWSTLRQLFTRPGALAEAYLAGRRTGAIRPLRLYLLLSIPLLFLSKSSVTSLQFLVTGSGAFAQPFAAAIARGARMEGLTEAAYLAKRNVVFQNFHSISTLYVSTALVILACAVLWRRRRPNFGEHAVFVLYSACATDLVMTVTTWLAYQTSLPLLVSATANLGMLYMAGYFFLAARRVYGDGRLLTLVKVGVLMVTFLVYSMFSVLVSLLVAIPLLHKGP